MIFSIFSFFLHPQIPDFQIVVSQANIVITNHTSMEILFIQLSDKKKKNIDTYDWFNGPFDKYLIN